MLHPGRKVDIPFFYLLVIAFRLYAGGFALDVADLAGIVNLFADVAPVIRVLELHDRSWSQA